MGIIGKILILKFLKVLLTIMKRFIGFTVLVFMMFLISCYEKGPEIKSFPSDYLQLQRTFPYDKIDKEAYVNAVMLHIEDAYKNSGTLDDPWQSRGPLNFSGRITDIEMHPSDTLTIYAGSASGGIFKSEDQAETWESIFDEQGTLAIGDIAIANSNKNIIYVGTGEANGGGGSIAYDGLGIYKSEDAGSSWKHLGLENIGSVGRIMVHPVNPDIIYVAGMGSLFEKNSERGVFKCI